jgi:hypothetical protein
MKISIIKFLTCAAVVGGLAASSQAALIVGTFSMGGASGQLDGTLGDLTTASHMTLNTFVFNAGSAINGNNISGLSPIAWPFVINVNGAVASPNVGSLGTLLFEIVVAGKTYDFNTTTVAMDGAPTPSSANLKGTGMISDGTPADNTPGNWALGFTSVNDNGNFSFSWSGTGDTGRQPLPDGGMTMMLLGAALSGLALLRRKLA